VEMSTLPDHIQNAYKDGLSQVPQRVLWKYDGEMKNKPTNVMTRKWFPQREILCKNLLRYLVTIYIYVYYIIWYIPNAIVF